MQKRSTSLFLTTAIMFCVSVTGCQPGNQDASQDTVNGDQRSNGVKEEQASLAVSSVVVTLTVPQQDALDAFNRGDKKLLGVQTRGVSVPGVDEALLPVLRERYGVTLRHVADVMKDQKDRDSIAEVFTYVRQYNGKMAELLRAEL
jgi:hypothetical protein